MQVNRLFNHVCLFKIVMHNKWGSTFSLFAVVAPTSARTQELEQQQPGVEGELRTLLEKPGKILQTFRLPFSVFFVLFCFHQAKMCRLYASQII